MIGPAILVLGILVCISVQYSPWWTINAVVYQNGQPVYCENYWTTVFPSAAVFTRCTGPAMSSAPTSGQTLDTPNVVGVTAVGADASLLAGVLAAVVILLSVVPRPGLLPRRGLATVVLVIGILAATASFAGAAYYVEELPHAWQSDNYTYQTGDPGSPSFSGSNAAVPHSQDPNINPNVTESWSWGPAIGWYLTWGSGVVILVGSAAAWRALSRDDGQKVRRGPSSV